MSARPAVPGRVNRHFGDQDHKFVKILVQNTGFIFGNSMTLDRVLHDLYHLGMETALKNSPTVLYGSVKHSQC